MATKLAATVAILALLSAVLTLTALTLFTDTQSVPANTFTTGTVDISTSPTSALVTFSGMAPGDQVVNPITVSNAGSLQLRYAVTSTTTENTLAAQLDMTIWDENEEADGGTTCNTTAPAIVLYAPADLGSTAGTNVIGNPAQGSQAGDRTLNAAASEVLCVKVSLPSSTGNTFQGLTSTATFAFQAEQTSSNP